MNKGDPSMLASDPASIFGSGFRPRRNPPHARVNLRRSRSKVSVYSDHEPAGAGMIATWGWIEGDARQDDKPSRRRCQVSDGGTAGSLKLAQPPGRMQGPGHITLCSECGVTNGAVFIRGKAMAAELEVVMDPAVGG